MTPVFYRRMSLLGMIGFTLLFLTQLVILVHWWPAGTPDASYVTIIISLVHYILFSGICLCAFLTPKVREDTIRSTLIIGLLVILSFEASGLGLSILVHILSNGFMLHPSNPLEVVFVVYQWSMTIIGGVAGIALGGLILYAMGFLFVYPLGKCFCNGGKYCSDCCTGLCDCCGQCGPSCREACGSSSAEEPLV